MLYRKLPHGNEQISVLGMGTSVVGEVSEKNVVETIIYALDHGINYIDLAGGHDSGSLSFQIPIPEPPSTGKDLQNI